MDFNRNVHRRLARLKAEQKDPGGFSIHFLKAGHLSG
jgi:hypothetical protein